MPLPRSALLVVLAACAFTSSAAAAGAASAEPALRTPPATLRAAVTCPPAVRDGAREPVLLVHGTGDTGRATWAGTVDVQGVLARAGHPACVVELPRFALADVQDSAEYVVSAIRAASRLADRPIAVYGYSQGGLLARWALTFWPSLRPLVADVVSVAGPQHGTTYGDSAEVIAALCSPAAGCPPAYWQQGVDAHLIAALGRRPDETPGSTAWTTVRSADDDLVQPETGPRPTSSLAGATNVLIQATCPGRQVSHEDIKYDSVSYAALLDAITHAGPARTRRFPRDVCAALHAPGLTDVAVAAHATTAEATATARTLAYTPQATAEPPLRAYAR